MVDAYDSDLLHVQNYEDLLEGYARLCQYLEGQALRLDPSSRIAEYGRALRDLMAGGMVWNAKSAHIVRRALTASYELGQILAIVGTFGEERTFPPRVRDLIQGSFDAGTGAKDSGRDFQFELFTAAAFKRAGLTVRLVEPDVQFDFEGRSLSIAAKRPRSVNSVQKLVRKALEQILRADVPGLIALDLTPIALPPAGAFILQGPDDVRAFARQVVTQVVDRVDHLVFPELHRRKWRGLPAGVVFFAELPVVSSSTMHLASAEHWEIVSRGGRGNLAPLLRQLSQRLTIGTAPDLVAASRRLTFLQQVLSG